MRGCSLVLRLRARLFCFRLGFGFPARSFGRTIYCLGIGHFRISHARIKVDTLRPQLIRQFVGGAQSRLLANRSADQRGFELRILRRLLDRLRLLARGLGILLPAPGVAVNLLLTAGRNGLVLFRDWRLAEGAVNDNRRHLLQRRPFLSQSVNALRATLADQFRCEAILHCRRIKLVQANAEAFD